MRKQVLHASFDILAFLSGFGVLAVGIAFVAVTALVAVLG